MCAGMRESLLLNSKIQQCDVDMPQFPVMGNGGFRVLSSFSTLCFKSFFPALKRVGVFVIQLLHEANYLAFDGNAGVRSR